MRSTRTKRREYKKIIEGLPTIEVYCKVILGKGVKSGMSRFPTCFWKIEENGCDKIARQRARECTRYLIGTILRWNRKQVCKSLRLSTFCDNNLSGMIDKLYGNSPYEAISDAFPEEDYKQWELNSCPQGFWKNSVENRKIAILWLLEKFSNPTEADFCDNGLKYLLREYFGLNINKAISFATET